MKRNVGWRHLRVVSEHEDRQRTFSVIDLFTGRRQRASERPKSRVVRRTAAAMLLCDRCSGYILRGEEYECVFDPDTNDMRVVRNQHCNHFCDRLPDPDLLPAA